MIGLLLKILLSPVLVFVVAYIYFQDTRKAVLVALYFYSAFSILSLIFKSIGIFTSMATFNLVSFARKSFQAITMVIMLGLYWVGYLLIWGSEFAL